MKWKKTIILAVAIFVLSIVVGVASPKNHWLSDVAVVLFLLSPSVLFINLIIIKTKRSSKITPESISKSSDKTVIPKEESAEKKCPFCAEKIQEEAIVCKHCGKELDKREVKRKEYRWTPLKIGCAVFLLIFVLVAVISCVRSKLPSSEPVNNAPQESQEKIDFSRIENDVNELVKTGLIKKLNPELNEAYVVGSVWYMLNVEEKRSIAETLAFFVGHKKGTDLYWVDIYDWQSGKKLAKYSAVWGFTIY